jgi:hypothetical protein
VPGVRHWSAFDGRHECVAVDDELGLDADTLRRPLEACRVHRGRAVVAVAEDRQHRWMAMADRRSETLDAVAQLGAQVAREGPPVEKPGRHPS